MVIEGKFRWEPQKIGDHIATGEIPLIIFDSVTYQFPQMTRLIDTSKDEWQTMFEGVKFKYTKVTSSFTKSFFHGIKGEFDWAIEVDESSYDRIEVYKHTVPIHLHQPVKVF